MGPYCLTPSEPQAIHTATTTGNGGILYLRGQTARVTIAIQGTGTTSGGTLTIEEAVYNMDIPSDGFPITGVYAGTWSSLQVVNASDVSTGKQEVIHLTGSFWAVRCRISSDITGGGTVSVWGWGN